MALGLREMRAAEAQGKLGCAQYNYDEIYIIYMQPQRIGTCNFLGSGCLSSWGGWTRSGPAPPDLSSRSLFSSGGERERERERERAWYTHFFFGKCFPSRAFQRRSFAADREERRFFTCILLIVPCNTTMMKYISYTCCYNGLGHVVS